ncbi:MAG: ComEC/Rec2 family competence protein [Candidatus Peregrinibacteria bacterium]
MIVIAVKTKKFIAAVIVLGYMAAAWLLIQLPDNDFHIYFLDVGQGDSIFIKTPENHQILIDGGGSDGGVIEQLGQVMPFFDKSIDLVILTHPHSDHVDGLVEVIKRYDVSNVLITGVYSDYAGYFEFLDGIYEAGANVFFADSNENFRFADVNIDVLYPFDEIIGEYFENLNNSSIAIMASYSDKKILLTGDLEIEGEKALVESGDNLDADILKAGHHGSKTASSDEFLKKVKPETVVIQCGEGNSFGHPHEETLFNLEEAGVGKIYRNDLDGRVDIKF